MEKFLKIVLLIIVVGYFLKLIFRKLAPKMFAWLIKYIAKRNGFVFESPQAKKKEGAVTIVDNKAKNNTRPRADNAEFAEYEEIRD